MKYLIYVTGVAKYDYNYFYKILQCNGRFQRVMNLIHASLKLFVFLNKGANGWVRNDGNGAWAKGQPDNFEGNEDCLHLWAGHGFQMNDFDCSGSVGVTGTEFRALCQHFVR